MPAAQKKFRPRSPGSSDATAVPKRGKRLARSSAAAAGSEAALLREFLRCESVGALADSLAARIADGTSPEEFIAAAKRAAWA